MTATLIDLIVASGVTMIASWILSLSGASMLGFAFFLLRDTHFNGFGSLSLGKRNLGLKVVQANGEPCDALTSFKRNLPLVVAFALGILVGLVGSILPWIGGVLGFFLFWAAILLIVGTEVYKLFEDKRGIRLGDLFAGTIVTSSNTASQPKNTEENP